MPTLADADQNEVTQILQSAVITLIPSDADVRLQIHEGLLVSLSAPLRAAVQGTWEESNTRAYKFWEDTTKEILICFIAWAYHGKFDTEAVGISSHVEEDVEFDEWGFQKKSKSRRKRDIVYELAEKATKESSSAYVKDKLDVEDETGSLHPLLLYVQVYTFADIYLIESFKSLAEVKIAVYLEKVENAKESYAKAIFDLLNYACSKLPEDDKLLNWLAKYSGWKLGSLRENQERLDDLLTMEEGKFARLLIRQVSAGQTSPFTG